MIMNILNRVPPGPEINYYQQYAQNSHFCGIPSAYHRIAKLLPVADSLLKQDLDVQTSDDNLPRVLEMMVSEDRKFEVWQDEGEDSYVYWELDRDNLLAVLRQAKPAALPKTVHCYKDILVPGLCNTYRAARIILLQTTTRLAALATLRPGLSAMRSYFDQLGVKALNDIDKTVNDILASIPYILGEVDEDGWPMQDAEPSKAFAAVSLMVPLRVCLMANTLTAEQKNYVFQKLDSIHRTTGFKKAAAVKKMR